VYRDTTMSNFSLIAVAPVSKTFYYDVDTDLIEAAFYGVSAVYAAGSEPKLAIISTALINIDNDDVGTQNSLDSDDDNDAVLDVDDTFPFDPNETIDTDGDGTGNNADLDDDNDGTSDVDEIASGRNPLLNEGAVIPAIVPVLLEEDV